jgi:hypothetical protein
MHNSFDWKAVRRNHFGFCVFFFADWQIGTFVPTGLHGRAIAAVAG